MNTIEFSHRYTKLPAGIKTAALIACEPVRGQDQTQIFIGYDTAHQLRDVDSNVVFKEIRTGDYLCLVLKSDSGAIFTTLRKDNKENREKYGFWTGEGTQSSIRYWKPRIPQEFQIIIKEG